jgi:flagellar biosynthesis/type III secretory pathway protein FliH
LGLSRKFLLAFHILHFLWTCRLDLLFSRASSDLLPFLCSAGHDAGAHDSFVVIYYLSSKYITGGPMASDSSLGEALCQFHIFCETHEETRHQYASSSISSWLAPTAALSTQSQIQDQSALITSPPELRLRFAIPEPQNADTCQQAEQSASQAIQQASQQASQSIQQASQSIQQASQQASQQISQSAAAASRSASQAIQQAQQSASQSIADAQRSVSSAISSASSAISSVQASAASAISQANGQMQSAQISASLAQSVASKVVAAATGSVAAAGSSFLSAAAKATQSADASVSAFGAAAASSVSQASLQASASQTQAVTATQAALAIVGSIIASALITILIYFFIARHKKKAKQRSRVQPSPTSAYPSNPKFPVSDQVGTTIAASQSDYSTAAVPNSNDFSAKPTTSKDSNNGIPTIKTSTVSWNPANPPKAPRLTSWLKLQDGVSPFGPITLPTDVNAASPLGGQLKSPHQTIDRAPSLRFKTNPPLRSPAIPVLMEYKPPVSVVNIPPKRNPTIRKPMNPPSKPETPPVDYKSYRESKASVWTDEVPDDGPSPALQSPPRAPKEPATVTGGYGMKLPSPKNPRSTAEWLAERAVNRDSSNTVTSQRPSYGIGLPRNPRASRAPQRAQSMQGEIGEVQGLNRFLDPNRGSTISRAESGSSQSTIGVGKAV